MSRTGHSPRQRRHGNLVPQVRNKTSKHRTSLSLEIQFIFHVSSNQNERRETLKKQKKGKFNSRASNHIRIETRTAVDLYWLNENTARQRLTR